MVDANLPAKGLGGFIDRHSRGLAASVPICAAIVAATAVLFIEKAGGGTWELRQYLENLVQNVFVGGLVALVLVWLSQRERRMAEEAAEREANRAYEEQLTNTRRLTDVAVSSWSALLGDSAPGDAADELQAQGLSLRANAADLKSILGRWTDSTSDVGVVRSDFERVTAIVWLYINGGGRARRLDYLDRINKLVPTVAGFEKDMAATGEERLRAVGPAIAGARFNTDATALEASVVPRSENGIKMPLTTEEGATRIQLAAATVAFEPLYLLYECLQRRTDSLRTPIDVEEATQQFQRPLSALGDEIGYVADALLALHLLVLGVRMRPHPVVPGGLETAPDS